MDKAQKEQEGQYKIPYHYIPSVTSMGYSQTILWDWGIRYMGGLELVLSKLEKIDFTSLIDVGCGDGRFLRDVVSRYSNKRVLGVDYSTRAIALANALNPDLEYRCINILEDNLDRTFDVATMIEVLEHIHPDSVGTFLKATAQLLNKNGLLLLTVPHVNSFKQEKHYQHFSVATLQAALDPYFKVESIMPFDRRSVLLYVLTKLLGYKGNNYVITNRYLNSLMYRLALRGCLKEQPEDRCSRLLAIAKSH